jgi:hypothetical protein
MDIVAYAHDHHGQSVQHETSGSAARDFSSMTACEALCFLYCQWLGAGEYTANSNA